MVVRTLRRIVVVAVTTTLTVATAAVCGAAPAAAADTAPASTFLSPVEGAVSTSVNVSCSKPLVPGVAITHQQVGLVEMHQELTASAAAACVDLQQSAYVAFLSFRFEYLALGAPDWAPLLICPQQDDRAFASLAGVATPRTAAEICVIPSYSPYAGYGKRYRAHAIVTTSVSAEAHHGYSQEWTWPVPAYTTADAPGSRP